MSPGWGDIGGGGERSWAGGVFRGRPGGGADLLLPGSREGRPQAPIPVLHPGALPPEKRCTERGGGAPSGVAGRRACDNLGLP